MKAKLAKLKSLLPILVCAHLTINALRFIIMIECCISMIAYLLISDYPNATWQATVAIAICPLWDETTGKT